jgi:hypothetical protein
LEEVMGEDVALAVGAEFVEAVEVELPDEGGVVGVLEVFGEYLFGEVGDILDDESILLGDPLDGVRVFGILNGGQMYIDYPVGFRQEYRNRIEDFVFALLLLLFSALHLGIFQIISFLYVDDISKREINYNWNFSGGFIGCGEWVP